MIRLAKRLISVAIHRVAYRGFSANALIRLNGRAGTADGDGSSYFTKLALAAVLTVSVGVECEQPAEARDPKGVHYSRDNVISNWSATHVCKPARQYEPKSAQEVCRVLESHHAEKRKIRPIGTALSPNGIGMSNDDVLSVAALDYIEVDKERMLVTVGAGTTVSAILKELAKHNLTLENFSSIQEQQIAGWTQVAAHGTGCTLPTVEEMIVRMKLATPTEGLLTLSDSLNPRLFRMAKAGLGCLGVVTELTLRCIPSHKLLEYTFTVPISKLAEKHYSRLQHFRHVRYMWFPYTTKVCAVVSNPTGVNDSKVAEEAAKIDKELLGGSGSGFKLSSIAPTSAMCELLLSQRPDLDKRKVHALSFSQLRDQLLDLDPLDAQLVRRINAAEAEYWERSAGFRADDSTSVLGFDCGGEQWVMEVCFPIGTLADKTGKDLEFVRRLLELIETHELPAPSPIEQRWTARSTSPMSPAYSINPTEIFSWVGVIMYLPPNQTDEQRQQIARVFRRYVELMRPLCEEFRAQCHWAKIEAPSRETEGDRARYADEVGRLQRHLQRKYPVDEFNQFRRALDPHRILSNELMETLFGR